MTDPHVQLHGVKGAIEILSKRFPDRFTGNHATDRQTIYRWRDSRINPMKPVQHSPDLWSHELLMTYTPPDRGASTLAERQAREKRRETLT